MSKIEERVITKLRDRAATGLAKYGTTMEREDLTKSEWLQHLQEELLDAAVYIEKLLALAREAKSPPIYIPLEKWPHWANWVAMDGTGRWFFYENQPDFSETDKCWGYVTGKMDSAGFLGLGHSFLPGDTLIRRPQPENQNSRPVNNLNNG